MELIVGNKNYSSWSLRGWLMLAAFDLDFKDTRLLLHTDTFYRELEKLGVAGKVPVLLDGDVTVWDSLAICEYVSETYLDGRGWPVDKTARAEARAVANEMHSGFMVLRGEMPMNCRAKRRIEPSAAAMQDVARIDVIWSGLRARFADQGPWLFGEFSIADVMFAPVVSRFETYGIEVSDLSRSYMATVMEHPAMQEWIEAGKQESEVVESDEVGIDV